MVNKTGNLNVVEDWRRVHEAFEKINFNAFDFDTIKASLIEYLRLYFPEDFNDYIESSEVIAIIETFAYVGELLAYRLDLNAHENNLDQAERKESILRLARMISFNASRRQSARGLVRIEAVSTTEEVRDSLNNNLRNRTIRYNDPNNVNWQEQFFTVIQRMLQQTFGEPQKSEIIDGNTFERYSTKISDLDKGVFPFSVTTSVKSVQMELVSTDVEESGVVEAVPNPAGDFQILFVNDGLGFGSSGTGFQILTVQGEIIKNSFNFEQPVPNRPVELPQQGLNNNDVHVIQVETVSEDDILSVWSKVDTVQGDTLHFNPGTAREIYEVISLDDDRVQINFGDAPFATIPVGPFNIWVRISEEDPIVIQRNRIQDKEFSFNYSDAEGNIQQGIFRFSLPETIANAVASQDLEDIRRIAPSIYYTQNRMVNSRDYNEFLFQDPAVLKLKSVVRTFSGQTKFQKFQDASGNFQNIKIFGDDIRFYLSEDVDATIFSSAQGATDNQIITTLIEPVLAETAVQDHLERVQGVFNPRSQFRESVNVSAQFSLEFDRISGSVGASAGGSGLNVRFDVDGSVGTFSTSNAGFFVADGVAVTASVINSSNAAIEVSAAASVYMAASIGTVPFSSTNFIPYPQRGHNQEKTEIQGRVDGRYFGTVGSAISEYSADGLVRTINNKNVYILDLNIPASAWLAGVTASTFEPGGIVGGSALGTTATIEAVYPVPNASGVPASVFGVALIAYLSASSTATASYNHGETISLTVSGSVILGNGVTTAVARVISGSAAAIANTVHTYQFQAGGASSIGASSVGQHEETASNFVVITGATSNDAWGIAYDKILDQFYTIAPADIGSESALWSSENARSITGSSLDNSWLIRVQPIRSGGATSWKVSKRISEIATQGITTDFFYQNDRQLSNPDTGLVVEDVVTALGVNFNTRNDAAIGSNLSFPVVSQPVDSITSQSDRDLLIVKEKDTNQDGVPDNPLQFEALVDKVSNRLILSPVGDGNDLTVSPPEQQVARDAATVFGNARHAFRFSDGDVRWQEQTNRWSRGAFVQEFVDQSAYISASQTGGAGSSYDYSYTFPIGGSLMGAAPDGPLVLAGSTAAPSSTLVELVRGSNYIIAGSDLDIIRIAEASSLFTTLGGSTQNAIIQVRQRGITTSVVDNLHMASNTTLNTTGDVPFTIESYINANQTNVSSFVVYNQLENLDASSAGFRFSVADDTVTFDLAGEATSGSDLLTATVTTTGLLDGTFHHIAGVYSIAMAITNSALVDLSGIKLGDRVVNTTNSSLATVYNLEVVNTSNAYLWVRDIVDNQSGSSSLFGFEGLDAVRLESLQADGSFSSLDAASSLVAASDMGTYIRAFVDGSAGAAVSASALTLRDVNPSAIVVGMMNGVYPTAGAPRPAVYFDGISLTREARYGGTYTPGRIQPQTVFFSRTSVLEDFQPVTTLPTPADLNSDQDSLAPGSRLFRELIGRDDINFLWTHFTPNSNLIDPSKTNIIDMFIHTAGYQDELSAWIARDLLAEPQPRPPTPTDLRIAFGSFLDKAMLSDTVILHPGRLKFLFGRKASETLRAKFRVVKRTESLVADDHLRTLVLNVIDDFFDITRWDFGRIFYATELYAEIHARLPKDVQSVLLIPSAADNRFGDLHQIEPEGDEILQSAARGADIEIIEDITRTNIRRAES